MPSFFRHVATWSLTFGLLTNAGVLAQAAWNATPGPTYRVWQPVEFAFHTAAVAPGGLDENSASPFNPWLDWRLSACFRAPSGRTFEVPGFYAADGMGGGRGSVWKTRFTPCESGLWRIRLRFEQGRDLNLDDISRRGASLFPHGMGFKFQVLPADPSAPGFFGHGPLEYVGEHYLRHRDGTWFVKGGTNSPENFLAYAGFDGARDLGGLPRSTSFLHRYAAHVAHWQSGDPNWRSGGDPDAGKAIIGAINYLASEGVNSVFFLPLNLGGDGQDTFPFVDPTTSDYQKVTHYDVGRMEQWNVVFEHAQRMGVQLSFVLAEQEQPNINWLGNGLTKQRKLFLKSLASMFGHHLALRWILCEENSAEPTDEFTVSELNQIAWYLKKWLVFEHPLTVHTDPDDTTLYRQIRNSGGGAWLNATSLQMTVNYNPQTEAARLLFGSHKPIVDQDEQGPAGDGLSNRNVNSRRKLILWDVLLSGGNIEWYLGYHTLPLGGDIRLEDFATRRDMWRQMRWARELIEQFPFWQMAPHDELVTRETRNSLYGDAEVFAKLGQDYIVYFAEASQTGMLDLRAVPSNDTLRLRWINPRTGRQEANSWTVSGGQTVWLPPPPRTPSEDWVLTARRR